MLPIHSYGQESTAALHWGHQCRGGKAFFSWYLANLPASTGHEAMGEAICCVSVEQILCYLLMKSSSSSSTWPSSPHPHPDGRHFAGHVKSKRLWKKVEEAHQTKAHLFYPSIAGQTNRGLIGDWLSASKYSSRYCLKSLFPADLQNCSEVQCDWMGMKTPIFFI